MRFFIPGMPLTPSGSRKSGPTLKSRPGLRWRHYSEVGGGAAPGRRLGAQAWCIVSSDRSPRRMGEGEDVAHLENKEVAIQMMVTSTYRSRSTPRKQAKRLWISVMLVLAITLAAIALVAVRA